MAICPLCEKKFQDRRGLHGHFRFVHGIEYSSGRPAKRTALTEATKRVIERKKEEKELIESIKDGEFELIPRSKIGWNREIKRDQFEELRETPKRREDATRFEGLKEGLKRWR